MIKIDWPHATLIAVAVASAVGPFATQAAQGKPVDTGAIVAAAFALATTIGALLKPSVSTSVNENAALSSLAEKALK
jgi:MFS-type transporter involved in bile tolerance (Atg22 family)